MTEINLGLKSQYIDFTPTEGKDAKLYVESGRLGEVKEISDDWSTITTEYGTLKLSGPKLEAIKGQIKVGDYLHANQSLESLKENVGTDIFMMMGLFHEIGKEMKSQARIDRQASREAQMKQLQSAANMMRDAANKAMWAGIISGVCGIVSGGFSVGAGLASIGGGMAGGLFSSNKEWSQSLMQVGSGISASTDALGKVVSNTGNIFSAWLNRDAEVSRAQQKEHETAATRAESQVQKENEMMQDMKELIKNVQEKLQAMQQSDHETMKNILRI